MAQDTDGEAIRKLRSVGGNGATPQDQLGMDETVIENEELAALLEARLRAGDDRREVNAVYARADEAAKDKIATLGLEDDAVVRVGRFRITRKSPKESEHVEYDTKPKARLQIELWQ